MWVEIHEDYGRINGDGHGDIQRGQDEVECLLVQEDWEREHMLLICSQP